MTAFYSVIASVKVPGAVVRLLSLGFVGVIGFSPALFGERRKTLALWISTVMS